MPKGEFPEGRTPWHKTSRRTLANFEAVGKAYGWWDDYQALRAEGHGWKVAAYIAWASSPRDHRQPETIKELCDQHLGVTARTLRNWRNADVSIDATVKAFQAAPLLAHRRDIFDALVAVAKDPDPKAHSDRKLALEMLGDYKPRSTVEHDGGVRFSDEYTADDLIQAELELDEWMQNANESSG